MKRFPSLIAALLAALAVGGALAVARGGDSEPGDSSGDGAPSDGAAALAPELPKLVAAFRREQTPTDHLAGDPVRALDNLGDARPGESPQFARRLETGRGAVYAWPETDGVCYAWSASIGCTPTLVLADKGVLVGLRVTRDDPSSSPQVSLGGLARDGVQQIELVLDGGRSEAIAVENNAFLAEPSSVPKEVRWENPDGTPGTQRLRPGW